MLMYLKHALQDRLAGGAVASRELVEDAIREGAWRGAKVIGCKRCSTPC
jgi:hypothetical protein